MFDTVSKNKLNTIEKHEMSPPETKVLGVGEPYSTTL